MTDPLVPPLPADDATADTGPDTTVDATADAAADTTVDATADAAVDTAADMAGDIDRLAFDQALGELQAVVGRLEAGGLPLESSIELYERGVALHTHCARLLGQAELRVQRLVEGAGGRLALLDLRPDDGS